LSRFTNEIDGSSQATKRDGGIERGPAWFGRLRFHPFKYDIQKRLSYRIYIHPLLFNKARNSLEFVGSGHPGQFKKNRFAGGNYRPLSSHSLHSHSFILRIA